MLPLLWSEWEPSDAWQRASDPAPGPPVRHLVGVLTIGVRRPSIRLTGTVTESEDWLLGLPTERGIP